MIVESVGVSFLKRGARVVGVAMVSLCVVVLPVSLLAQSHSSGTDITPPKYGMNCLPLDKSRLVLHYSSSSDDVFGVKTDWEDVAFNVLEFNYELLEEGPQFLKGYFFDESVGTEPIGFSIPEDRKDEYRRDDGMREIWFVPSDQWRCYAFLDDGVKKYPMQNPGTLGKGDRYEWSCKRGKHLLKEKHYLFYSFASSDSIFHILIDNYDYEYDDEFHVVGLEDEEGTGRQFLKGFSKQNFGMLSSDEEYRREDGTRVIWFVPSDQWGCGGLGLSGG